MVEVRRGRRAQYSCEMSIPPGKGTRVLLRHGENKDKKRLEENEQYLKKLAKLSDIRFLSENEDAPVASTALVGELEILVPMADLIDRDAELARLAKEIDKAEKDLSRVEGKLSNSSFVDKAPEEVVDKERQKMLALQQALEKLKVQQQQIQQL